MTDASGLGAVRTACNRLLGAAPMRAVPLARSEHSAVFRVWLPNVERPVIVKVYQGTAAWKADKEQRVIEGLAASGHRAFTTPAVLAAGLLPDGVRALCLQDGGTSLQDALDQFRYPRTKALSVLNKLLASVHLQPDLQVPRLRSLAEQVRHLQERLPLSVHDATAQVLDDVLTAGARAEQVWCHGDLHFANILLPEGQPDAPPCLIDFEETTYAPAAYDLAQSAVTTETLDPAGLALLTRGHEVDPRLLDGLIVFHCLRGRFYAHRDTARWHTRLEAALTRAHHRTHALRPRGF